MNEERATQAFELNSNGAPLALDQTSGFTYYSLLITYYFSPQGVVREPYCLIALGFSYKKFYLYIIQSLQK